MRSAEEARRIIEQGACEKVKKQWEDIENVIEQSLNSGYRYTTFTGILEKSNRTKLENLGYKIDVGSQYNESYFSISW